MQTGKLIFNLFGLRWIKWSVKFTCTESFDQMNQQQLSWWSTNVWEKLSYYFEKPLPDSELVVKDENRFVIWNLQIAQQLTGIPTWLFRHIDIDTQRHIVFNWKLGHFMFNTTYAPEYIPIKSFKGLYGPLSSVEFNAWEFSFVDVNYLKYKKSRNSKYLFRFLAHMFRYPKPSFDPNRHSDIRETFNHHSYTLRLSTIEKMPKSQQLLILYWYETWRLSLPKAFNYLFTASAVSSATSNESWVPVFQSASGGIHNFEAIQKMNCLLLFSEINRLIKQQKDREAKAARSK